MRSTAPLRAIFSICLLVLAGCGGGDSGGGGSTQPVARGAFTISGNSATFRGLQGGVAPASQAFQVTIQGADVAYFGAAYAAGQGTQPAWLTINANGSGTSFQLVIGVIAGAVVPGNYTTTFSVGTTDASGSILARQDFTVSFELLARTSISTPPVLQNMVFGELPRVRTVAVTVNAPGRNWSASSNASWLQVSNASHTGSSSIDVTLDTTALAPGSYSGQLAVTGAGTTDDTATLPVALTIADPQLTVQPANVVFGGSDGLAALTPVSLPVSLNTGNATYPFTVAVSMDGSGSWLQTNATGGNVGSAGTVVTLSAARGTLRGGTYTGQVRVTASVFGRLYEQLRPVTLNIEADRMVVSATGVGLSRVGPREVLSRALRVYSSTGRASMSWQATANVPWLNVTPSGTAGGALVITANPTGLASETTHYATVTVTSPDATVENSQTVRVGLHVTATPAVDVSAVYSGEFMAASPVDPWVAVSNGGTAVSLYNVYTGALVRTLGGASARAGAIAFSDDGQRLYVFDRTNLRVKAVNAVTGAELGTYDASVAGNSGSGAEAVAMIRPAGFDLLLTAGGRLHVISGPALPTVQQVGFGQMSLSWSRSPDQFLVATHFGTAYRLKYSALLGGSLTSAPAVTVGTAQGRDGEACISAAGDRIYTASGFPYDFPATSTDTAQVVQRLPGTNYPNAIQCVWNGLVVGGADAYYSDNDIFVYNGASGDPRGQFSSNGLPGGYRSLFNRGLAVSADGTRLMSSWSSPASVGTGTYFRNLPAP